jgi:hypothetical protein
MKRVRVLILVCVVFVMAATVAGPAAAQAEFACETGQVITNGVEFNINIRPGDYRATVLGLNGFDPVLAVIEPGTGAHLCNDDEPNAAGYAAALPTTGEVAPSGLSAQMDFNNTGDDFLDLALLVGGLNGQSGEFILIFQGMQVTEADGDGDPFQITASANVVDSGVGIHAYVVHVEPNLDPLLRVITVDGDEVAIDGVPVACDDAGNPDSCWTAGDPVVSLEGFGFTDGQNTAVADPYDPYISVPATMLDPETPYILFEVSSFRGEQGQSTGEYIFAIHTGTAGANGSASGSTGNVIPSGQPGGPSTTTTTADVTPITCAETGTGSLLADGQPNQFLNVECPANCTTGGIWGTNVYTDDSAVCAAAIHAGVIPASGGAFAVAIAEGQSSYEGSTQNGITSSSWGRWQRSIVPLPLVEDSSGAESGNTGSNSGNTGNTGTTSADVTLQPIVYGDKLAAEIGSIAGDAYSFNASARDVVTIAVNSEDFDPLIIVTDTNGRELTRDDDGGDGFNALVSNLRIPSDGEFIIVVTSFGGALDVGSVYTIELLGG